VTPALLSTNAGGRIDASGPTGCLTGSDRRSLLHHSESAIHCAISHPQVFGERTDWPMALTTTAEVEQTHRLVANLGGGARWVLPWIAVMALSASEHEGAARKRVGPRWVAQAAADACLANGRCRSAPGRLAVGVIRWEMLAARGPMLIRRGAHRCSRAIGSGLAAGRCAVPIEEVVPI
jgi:hypothetical protein